MSVVRFLASLLGWLLTPFLAWAASFLGATIAAALLSNLASPQTALVIAFTLGLASAVVVTVFWLRWIRRSRRIQRTLHITEDGTPEVLSVPEPPASP
ncbi:MAG: hypothetical protein ABI647_03650 [Gemmatimonadota bacterium]